MSDGQPKTSITRRTAIKSMITGAAGAAVTCSAKPAAANEQQTASRAKLAKPSGAKRIERQPTGSEIWQIETQLRHSHTYASIYGERSWCSADSRYFLYMRQCVISPTCTQSSNQSSGISSVHTSLFSDAA
jgi:hypothetical protein